ncbi:hypothetical protein GQ53DRAFT_745157 [Thozetella sp. PMI_491]|nr:hypothetical protein GQ53DRAFT_745157 [Thozetella sp. PMI_491]
MDTAATLSNTVEGLVAAVTQSKGGTALPIRDLSGSGSKSGSEQRPSLLGTRRRGVLPRGSVTDLTGGLTQTTDEVTGGALGVAQPGGAKKVGDVLNSMSTAIGDSTPAPAGSGGAKN